MTLEAIHAAIPHRGPMLLVDKIVEQSEDRIVCEKTYRDDEFFVQGHYPNFQVVPGVILCESAMQTGAILLSKLVDADAGGVPVATRMNNVKFRRMIRPSDTILIEVTLTERMADTFFLAAKASCQGKVALRFDFGCTITPVS